MTILQRNVGGGVFTLAILALSALSVAWGQGSNTTTDTTNATITPPTTSAEKYVHWLYTSSDICKGDGSAIVGVRGFVALEEFEVLGGARRSGSCAKDISCLLDGDSDQCQSLSPNSVSTGYDAVSDDGSIYECETCDCILKPTEEDTCEVYDKDACFASGMYPSCNTGFLTTSELNDPALFSNPSASDHADMSNYYYIIYYSNDECSNVVGLRAFISQDNYTLPIVREDVSCEDAMACLYNEGGPSCEARRTNSTSDEFAYETRFNDAGEEEAELYSCQGTVSDLSGGECVFVDPMECTQSGVFLSQCKFRIVGASFLARNPKYVVGDFVDDGKGNGSSSSTSAGSNTGLVSAWISLITGVSLLFRQSSTA